MPSDRVAAALHWPACPRSASRPSSGPPATSRRRSSSWSRASRPASRTSRCSGATGTGKTFTIAHVIEQVQRPTLVIAPNKSLAAQLANEFREVFPDNAVEYFVSYYDYYQPEAYVPQTDTYIEKDSSVNDEIERLRHSATAALLGAARRPDRRERLVHLRPGLARGVRGPDPAAVHGHRHPARVRDAAARRHPVPAQQRQPRARHVPRAGRHARGLPAVRADRLPDRVVGRHDRADLAVRSRSRARSSRTTSSTSRSSRPRTTSPSEDRMKRALVDDRGGAARAARRARGPGQAARGRAAADAHDATTSR